MNVKLLTEHHLESLSLKGGLQRLGRVYTCENATLLEITCTGSNSKNLGEDGHTDCIMDTRVASSTGLSSCGTNVFKQA